MLRTVGRAFRRGHLNGNGSLQLASQGLNLGQQGQQEDKETSKKFAVGNLPQGVQNVRFGGFRGLQTGHTGQNDKLMKEMESVLQRIDAAHFTEILQNEAKTRWNMGQEEFRRLCVESGAASTQEDADQICEALDKSGVVLKIKNLVYLRPLEVAEILYKALPDTAEEVKSRLTQLKMEAAPLLEKKAQIDAQANRYAKTVLWTGFAVFTAQMILYCRLTFWELSWDVMEPVTYFTSATFAVLAYIYCMWHNEEFGILSARRRIHSNVQTKKYAEKGLDTSKLDFLLHRINRLEATIPGVETGPKSGNEKEPGTFTDPSGLQPVGQSLN